MLTFFATWRRERETIRRLARLSDRELTDIGVDRDHVTAVVKHASDARRNGTSSASGDGLDTLAPSWAGQNRRALARS